MITNSIPNLCTGLVLFVDALEKQIAFYQTLASMNIVLRDEGYAILEIPGFQLILHALTTPDQGESIASSPPCVRDDSYHKLCLPVLNIEHARQAAARLGGSIKSVEHEWEFRNFRACDGHDPEGNVIQVRMPLNN